MIKEPNLKLVFNVPLPLRQKIKRLAEVEHEGNISSLLRKLCSDYAANNTEKNIEAPSLKFLVREYNQSSQSDGRPRLYPEGTNQISLRLDRTSFNFIQHLADKDPAKNISVVVRKIIHYYLDHFISTT